MPRGLQANKQTPVLRSLLTRRVCLTLTNYAMLAFTSIANAGIFPVFMYTPVKLGGLGFTTFQVGRLVSCQVTFIFTSAYGFVLEFVDGNCHGLPSILDNNHPGYCFSPFTKEAWNHQNLPVHGGLLHTGLYHVSHH